MSTKKVSPYPMVNCPDLEKVILLFGEFLKTTVENEANTEIIFFLHDLVCNDDKDVRMALSQYIEYIGVAFMTSIPNIRSVVSHTFCK